MHLGLAAGAPAFLWDIAKNGKQLTNAVSDAWVSDKNYDENVKAMNHVGEFVFDTTLMSAGGLIGDKMARRYLSSLVTEARLNSISGKSAELLVNTDRSLPAIENAARSVERRIVPSVVPENTLSMRELAQKGDASFTATLEAYYPRLSNAFPDKAEIEAMSSYDRYLRDPTGTWDALVLRGKSGEILGGIQSQVVQVNGDTIKKAVWAEHIWLSPEARSYQNFSQLLNVAKGHFSKSNTGFVFMEFNDRAKMNWSQLVQDAEGGLATEAREKIWARVGLNVLTDKRGRVAPYAQPGMDGEAPVTYLSLGFAGTEPLAGKSIPTSDYAKLLRAAHSTIADVDSDPTVKQYMTKLTQMIHSGETEMTFARLSDTVVERLVRQRFITP